MIRWSLVAEFLALIILVMLFIRFYYYERNISFSPKGKFYLRCLGMSISTILLNMLCVFTIERSDVVPLWVNMALNSSYFFVNVLMCSLLAYYLFQQLLEHVYDKHCLKRAFTAITLITSAYAVLVILNLFTGILFYFDGQGHYQRGILNPIGYGCLILELILLLVCYVRNRPSVSDTMVDVIHGLPPLLFLVVLMQLFYPEILLNGTIIATANLVIVLNFHCRTNDRDSLTGIRNRNNFFTELNLRTAGRQKIQVLFLYLHEFSDINQTYGHQTGDAILYEIAHYLDKFSPTGRAFRYGNVTFALMLPMESYGAADAVIQKLRRRFAEPWSLGDVQMYLTCSIASLSTDTSEWSVSQITEYLEYTLRLARESEDHTVKFQPAIRQQIQRKKYLIESMRTSLQDHRFQVWYQPIFCCHHSCFCSAEALLRLTDYNGEIVSPAIFIPLAEETGLIDDLSWLVLDEVCRLLSTYAPTELEYISINVSLQFFQNPNLTSRILEYLHRYGLSPDRIRLEITERVLLHDMRSAQKQMQNLIQAGIRIYIDDFGTGYSNFSMVLDSPCECIKIDRNLISDLLTNEKKDLTVRTLMRLFHDMKRILVIEGVETKAQADRLMEYGADMIQGFYYASPMPEAAFQSFLEEHKPASPIS